MAETKPLSETIPIISLWMPWANWVALTWKPIETRTHKRFRSLVGKRIGIHASLKWDLSALDKACIYLTHVQREQSRNFLKVGGAVICTALVTEFRELTAEDSASALIECESVKRYGLILKDVKQIEAVPMKGRQGIWYAKVEKSNV